MKGKGILLYIQNDAKQCDSLINDISFCIVLYNNPPLHGWNIVNKAKNLKQSIIQYVRWEYYDIETSFIYDFLVLKNYWNKNGQVFIIK